MGELLLELLSEELPARMQKAAAEALGRMLSETLSALSPRHPIETFYGPRRIAAVADVEQEIAASSRTERGPRTSAPDAALDGFLRKHDAQREQVVVDGDYWILRSAVPARSASALVASVLPGLLRRFPWPKSMRWGSSSAFTWVRPLRRILCLLDGDVVPFDLRDGADDGHSLVSGSLTEGHRFLAPGSFPVASAAAWRASLLEHHVIVAAAERTAHIEAQLAPLLRTHGLTLVRDDGLSAEVAGLVEWPVPLLGRIDAQFMDLPAEVIQVSMRVNQRYFALRDAHGDAAPWFAFIANIEAPDGGAAMVAGNERVLRARLSDARHFWDLDRAMRLDSRVAALKGVTFHARLGSQADRVERIIKLATYLAPRVGADIEQAGRAALLCKADLVTFMVGEFPELQGVMGGYYAAHDGEAPDVVAAIREHYLPRGPSDPVPQRRVSVAVGLADKLDTLAGFFGIGEAPTGSGDPYGLRRAALGVLRIVREHQVRIQLRDVIEQARSPDTNAANTDALLSFMVERLRVQLRAEGARHDVFHAVCITPDSDIVRLLERARAVEQFLGTAEGDHLLAAYRRAANIVRIEQRKDGPHCGPPEAALFAEPAEHALYRALQAASAHNPLLVEDDARAMRALATLREPVDQFFETVRVNDEDPQQRVNRLRLLGMLRDRMDDVADFSRIEG